MDTSSFKTIQKQSYLEYPWGMTPLRFGWFYREPALNKYDRLAAAILVQTSRSLENQNIFSNIITATAR
jgi:hypothetical protein